MIVDFDGFIFNTNEFSNLRTRNNDTWIELYAVMKNGKEICLYSSGHCYNNDDEYRRNQRRRMGKVKQQFSTAIGAVKTESLIVH